MATDRASNEGFGKGEFQVWCNNLRALFGAFTSFYVAYVYTFCRDRQLCPAFFQS